MSQERKPAIFLVWGNNLKRMTGNFVWLFHSSYTVLVGHNCNNYENMKEENHTKVSRFCLAY